MDAYLCGVPGSKSSHGNAADIVRTFFKLFEYLWLQGFYQIADAPPETWRSLRIALVEGGWTRALKIRERTASLLSKETLEPAQLLRESHRKREKPSVRQDALSALGTNIAGYELGVVRDILIAASAGADISAAPESERPGMSATMLKQCLRNINILADVEAPLGLTFIPNPNSFAFAENNGRAGKRTKNLTPEQGALILKEAFRWVLDYGDACVDLVEALAVQLSPYFEPRMRNGRSAGAFTAIKSYYAKRILAGLPERRRLEELLGVPIAGYRGRNMRPVVISVSGVLNSIFTACFIVLAAMNARRKDELAHPSIGLEAGCVRAVDEELGLYECRFFIEKTLQDYDWFFINDVSLQAIRILQRISEVAWDWEEHVSPTAVVQKKRTLFCCPRFASHAKGPLLRFDFNSTANGCSHDFVCTAFAGRSEIYQLISPHMFRRLYGLLYLYRYENSTLIALAQKYGHFDITSVFRYVQNGAEASVDSHAAAIWSKPARTIAGREEELQSIWSDLTMIGREKLMKFVEDVVGGVERFGGGFEKLVSRFHRRMRGTIEYSGLSEAEQVAAVGNVLASRGHTPQPFPHATCMAGDRRKHAACSRNGELAKERASPELCSVCTYSVVMRTHLDAMKNDLKGIELGNASKDETVAALVARRRQINLQRVIELNERRLAVTTNI